MWGAVEERLSTVARTIVFDMPGSGRSPTPRAPLSISDHAAVAVALLDELGHERADVVGFSLGGMVAQQLARDAADRVRRLALVATGCGLGGMPPTIEALVLLSMPLRYHSERVYHGTNRLLAEADRVLLARLSSLSESRLRHPPPLLGYAYQLAAGSLWSSLSWLDTVRVPTLVLVGSVDQVVPPANGYQLARLLPESRLHVLEGGHLCIFDPDGPAVELLRGVLLQRGVRGVQRVGLGHRDRRRRHRRGAAFLRPRARIRIASSAPPTGDSFTAEWGMARAKCVRTRLLG